MAAIPGCEADRQTWVEVRLQDFYAPQLHEPAGPAAKAALKRIAMGKQARCVADHRSHDRVVARCTIGGRDVGDMMRRACRGPRERLASLMAEIAANH